MAYVYKRGGRWYLGYRDESGGHVRKVSRARTKTEAQRLADELERQAERRRLGIEKAPPPEMTFAELAQRYLAVASSQLRSFADAEARFRLHLVPALGKRLISTITPVDVEELLASKRDTLGPQTREHLRHHLQAVFTFAIKKLKVLEGPNSAAEAAPVQVPPREIRYLDGEDIPRVLAAAEPEWRNLFAFAIYTGARKGEQLGTLVENVDLERRVVLISRSYEGPTKGAKVRVVPIPEELLPYVRDQLERARALGSRYLFPRPDGRPYDRNLDLADKFKRVLKRAGLVKGYELVCRRKGCGYSEERPSNEPFPCPRCGFRLWPRAIPIAMAYKDLRSTFGTHAYQATGDIRFVQATLGHGDPRLTERVYSHLQTGHLVSQADRIQFVSHNLLTRQADETSMAESAGEISQRIPPLSRARGTGLEPVDMR